MKKTIVSVLLTVCIVLTAFPVAAFELEQPETASAAEVTVGTSASSAELSAALPTEHETYGTLVYFEDFSGTAETVFDNLADVKVVKTGSASSKGDSACVQLDKISYDPTTIGVELAPADGGTNWKYTDGTPITGELTVAAEMYLDSSTVPNLFTVAYPGTTWGKYYTPWDGHTLKSQEWVTLYGRPQSTASYSVIGLATNAWQAVYMRSVALYVKNPTNALCLIDQNGENREFILVTDETYTFPGTFAGQTIEQWTDGTSFYAAGEQVNLADVAAKTFSPVVLPDSYSATYGQLVYYRDYTSGRGLTNCALADAKIVKLSGLSEKGDSHCVQLNQLQASPSTVGVEFAPADGGTVWQYADGTPLTGELTVAADMYLNSSTVPNLFTVAYPGTAWNDYYTPWDGHTLKSQEWVSLYGRALSTDSYSRIGLATNAWQEVYMRSVALYVKNPTNALWLTDQNGKNREFILVTDETYTFPDTFAGRTTEQWTDGTSFYAAGEQANLADIAAKTFSPVVLPETYSETYGQLVYYRDYTSGRGLTTCALADAKIVKLSGLSEKGDSYCVQLNQLQASPSTVGIEFAPADGGTVWQYADGTPLTGELTVGADMYLNNSSVPQMFTVASPGTTWGSYYTPWDSHTLISYAWAYKYSKPLDSATYSDIGLATDKWYEVYLRSAALYVKNPTNAFWLTDSDGANREFIVMPEETYTLPTEYKGTAVKKWTDGSNSYMAGSSFAKAELAGKTLTAINVSLTPTMLESNSIRFGENKGLRFAAVVDLALRANSATEEYGFLVTRKSLLGENANDTLKVWISDGSEVWDTEEKTVGLTEEGVTFVAGRAWKNDGSVDLIYDNAGGTKLDEESIKNGEAIGITAVLTGITDKRYGEVFVVRPYVKIAGSYFYGEACENSYYKVAKALRGSASYDSLTEEQKAEIDNVIASVEN